MKRTKPPFRADHVGSLLRPKALHEARAKRAKGEITAAGAEGDRGPRDRARHQEAGGRRPAGDHRRRVPPLVVASRFPLGPRRRREARHGHRHRVSPRVTTRNEGVQVTGKLGMAGPHPMVEHFKFVAAHTKRTPKITIPAPSAIYGRPMLTPIDKTGLSGDGPVLGRSRPRLQEGGARLRRRRLPLSAARRGVHRHAVRSEVSRADDEARRRSGKARAALRRSHQRGDVGHSRPT